MSLRYDDILTAARQVDDPLVRVRHQGSYAIVELDDAPKRNVLSAALMVQLREAGEALVRDPDIRAIALTGSGQAFSAGGDLRMMAAFTESEDAPEGAFLPHSWIRHQFGAFARLIAKSDVAWVAALNGPAAGVGLAFALSCDVVLAGESAAIVPAFGRVGLVPEVGTSWALSRALGYRGAFAFFVRGEHLDARAAQRAGLVDEVVPDAELMAEARQWCERIAALPAHAVPLAKQLLRAAADQPWEQALQLEEMAEPICFTTHDFVRSIDAVTAATSSGSRS